jgi:hypothetical protein
MPHRVLRLFTSFCAALLFAVPVRGQTVDQAFRADIEKLLEVTGSVEMGKQMASLITTGMLDALTQSRPGIPERAITLAKEVLDTEIAKAFAEPDGLSAQLVTIYSRHFTHEDVRAMLAFYATDVGKKTIALMPVIFKEATAAGQQWGEKNVPRIQAALEARLKAEGFIK